MLTLSPLPSSSLPPSRPDRAAPQPAACVHFLLDTPYGRIERIVTPESPDSRGLARIAEAYDLLERELLSGIELPHSGGVGTLRYTDGSAVWNAIQAAAIIPAG